MEGKEFVVEDGDVIFFYVQRHSPRQEVSGLVTAAQAGMALSALLCDRPLEQTVSESLVAARRSQLPSQLYAACGVELVRALIAESDWSSIVAQKRTQNTHRCSHACEAPAWKFIAAY
jgi:hypothetical protein